MDSNRKTNSYENNNNNMPPDTPVWHTNTDIDVTSIKPESVTKRTSKAPDGGWGWVILGTCYISMAMNFGLQDSYGLFYPTIRERYSVPLGTVTWIGSCSTGLGSIAAGSLGPMIINRLGSRLTGVLSTGLLSGGLFLSMLLDNVYAMFITLGAMPGFSLYLQVLNSMVILNTYFDRKRVLVVGLAYSSAGMGSVVFAPIFTALLSTYGLWGALLVAGAITLNQLWCALTFRPLSKKKHDEIQETTDLEEKLGKGGRNPFISLMKRKTTWCIVLSAMANGIVNSYFTSFTPTAATFWLRNVSQEKISLIISAYGFSNMGIRVVIGCVFSAVRRSVIPTYNATMCGCGLVLAATPFCQSYETMMTAGSAYGLFYGTFISLFPTVALELFEPRLFSYANGIVFIVAGSCSFVGIPIAGLVYDRTLNFKIIFFMAAGGFILATLVLTPLLFSKFRNSDDSPDGLTVTVESQQNSEDGVTHHRSKG